MATSPSNTNPRILAPREASGESQASPSQNRSLEALQTLLAFSSLQDQTRRKRAEDAARYAVGLGPAPATDEQHFSLEEVLQVVAERALAITQADGIAIALAEGEEIICRASSGSMAPDRGVRIERTGFSGACLRARRIIRCDDSEQDSRVDVAACRKLGTRSMVAVPLISQESIVGILEAFSTEPFAFSDKKVQTLSVLADLIVGALQPEDEERIVNAARAAAAEFEGERIERLREMAASAQPADAASAEPPIPTPKESGDAPLEFAKEDIAPALYVESAPQRGWMRIAVAVAALAAMLACTWWWMRRTKTEAAATPAKGIDIPALSKSSASSLPDPKVVAAASSAPGVPSSTEIPPVVTPASRTFRSGDAAQVTAIQHWTKDGVSTVAIELQSEVQYETHRLDNPDRIYFDLHDTTLAGNLNARTIEIGDPILSRVRVAQPFDGITRVVLDTKAVATFSVHLEENPYRLVVDIRGPETKATPSQPSPAPKPNVEPPPKPSARPTPILTPANTAPASKPTAPPAPVNSAGVVPAPAPPAAQPSQTLAHAATLRVVIDAGHGGWDLGTVGRRGLLEKDLVLDVARRLGALAEKRLGAEVVLTRKDDNYVSLEQRAELANQTQADLFVSVHANYSDVATARGVETYYSSFFSPPEAREAQLGMNASTKPVSGAKLSTVELKEKVDGSRQLASDVQRALYDSLAASNPGIRNRGVREASYVVLAGTEMPAILAEISFVSSPADEERLQSGAYRQQIAEALYNGVAQYLQSRHHVKMASASGGPSGK
jgi:N-acetylmuramoyl-L-alanine amidase